MNEGAPLARRQVLGGFAAFGAATVLALPGGGAHATLAAPEGAAAPSADFLEAANLATGETAVDPVLAARVYTALRSRYPDLDAAAAKIASSLKTLNGDASSLLADASLKALFGDLMSGLYLGTIGPKMARECVAFETIESYRVVADALRPPSYCSGEPDFWTQPVASDTATDSK